MCQDALGTNQKPSVTSKTFGEVFHCKTHPHALHNFAYTDFSMLRTKEVHKHFVDQVKEKNSLTPKKCQLVLHNSCVSLQCKHMQMPAWQAQNKDCLNANGQKLLPLHSQTTCRFAINDYQTNKPCLTNIATHKYNTSWADFEAGWPRRGNPGAHTYVHACTHIYTQTHACSSIPRERTLKLVKRSSRAWMRWVAEKRESWSTRAAECDDFGLKWSEQQTLVGRRAARDMFKHQTYIEQEE